MKLANTVAAMVIFAGLAACISANEQATAPDLDNNFLVKDAAGENAEIEFSKLASSRAGAQSVKDLAAQFVRDHSAAYEKLAQLFKNRKIAIVAGTDKEFRDELARLSGMKNAQFDRAYLQRMVEDHKKAVKLFEDQVNQGKESDITAYAKECLPTIQQHLKKAQELAATVGQ
jgi:putative membrane protein